MHATKAVARRKPDKNTGLNRDSNQPVECLSQLGTVHFVSSFYTRKDGAVGRILHRCVRAPEGGRLGGYFPREVLKNQVVEVHISCILRDLCSPRGSADAPIAPLCLLPPT